MSLLGDIAVEAATTEILEHIKKAKEKYAENETVVTALSELETKVDSIKRAAHLGWY